MALSKMKKHFGCRGGECKICWHRVWYYIKDLCRCNRALPFWPFMAFHYKFHNSRPRRLRC
jgi:hypothetical protein